VSKTSTPQKPKAKTPQRGLREGSTMWAAIEVLRDKLLLAAGFAPELASCVVRGARAPERLLG
jgi:hypothetical protein